MARAVRDVKVKQQGKENWWQGNGRPSKEQMIREYMFDHPTVGKQIDIANALKIDRHTVSKYYKKIRAELDIAQTRELNIPRVVIENGRIVVRVMPSQGLSDQIVDELKVQ